jgi:hypothetical protein
VGPWKNCFRGTLDGKGEDVLKFWEKDNNTLLSHKISFSFTTILQIKIPKKNSLIYYMYID